MGVTAPPDISQEYSEYRARVVAQVLEEEHGVDPGRIFTRGWGANAAFAAQSSQHPNAAVAQSGFGWAEAFFVISPCHEEPIFVPDRPDYYSLPSPPPPPATRTSVPSHPIFYMNPGSRVGERVALHLFESRYKLLILRVLATDKTFIYCAHEPAPGSDCVAVVVDRATFDGDGNADVWGRATETVTLDDVRLEEGTGGLYSTASPLSSVLQADEEPVPFLFSDSDHHLPTAPRARPSFFFFFALFFVALLAGFSASRSSRRARKLHFCPAPAVAVKVVAALPPPTTVNIVHTQVAEPV